VATHLSVFVENKPGKIESITRALAEGKINILGITIASRGEFGVVKILPSDPDRAFDLLRARQFTVSRRDVVIAIIPDRPGSLHELLEELSDRKVNLDDCYGFVLAKGKEAAVVLEVQDPAAAQRALEARGMRMLSDGDVHGL
jgi:hypothetical protein